jgi:hypothetical protein
VADETIDYKTDGTIRIISGTIQLRLKRPKAGQFRELQEGWNRVVETEREANAREAEIDDADTDAVRAGRDEREDEVHGAIFGWWREVSEMLDERGGKFPDDSDEMPIWLLDVATVTEAFQHWKSVPWVPGSRPSLREAEEMGPMLDKLQQILSVLPQAVQGQASSVA